MKIGQIIRKRREATGMKLEPFAELVGMDAGNLSKLERGIQGYTPERLDAIAAVLGTTASQLLAESESLATARQIAPSDTPPEKEERDLLRHYWQLGPSSRAALRQITAEMSRAANLQLGG